MHQVFKYALGAGYRCLVQLLKANIMGPQILVLLIHYVQTRYTLFARAMQVILLVTTA